MGYKTPTYVKTDDNELEGLETLAPDMSVSIALGAGVFAVTVLVGAATISAGE